MKHYEIEDVQAVHRFCFIGSADPSLDLENAVGPRKAWYDTSEGRLKFRSDDDTAWINVGAAVEA